MILSMMPVALHFMEHSPTRKGKWFSGACLLAFLLALTRTRSRMGFVGLIIMIAQVIWARRKKPIIIFIVLGLVLIALLNTHYRYFHRIEDIEDKKVQDSRVILWKQAIQIISLRPWLGVGPGNYLNSKHYFNIPGDKEHVAHNAFLELAAENGIIGLAVYMLIGVVSLRNLLYAEKRFRGKNEEFLSISRCIRIAYLVLLAAMMALSQQYNHFYLIFAAISARLKYFADQLENKK
jgi:O-antigen ligase